MKRYSMRLPFLFILLIIILIAYGQAEVQTSKPSISADEVFWDFGFVPFDYDLVHYYEIKNIGKDNLYISHIGTSCDCSYARALDTLIPPGASTKIKVHFSTADYYGKNTRTVSINSNDPDNPVFNLEFASLIGALPKQVAAQPNALFFLPAHKNKDIKLLNHSDSNIDVKIYPEPDSIIAISDTELEIDSGSYAIIKVTPGSDLGKGTYHSSFLVDFGTEPNIRITIPVKIVKY